jgi:L-serine dehydratase
MSISILDLFTIGIGPSSSHTVGPMRAARRFVVELKAAGRLEAATRVRVHLYGSLALTGKGHGTDKAVLLGLEGHTPESVPVDQIEVILGRVHRTHRLRLSEGPDLTLEPAADLCFHQGQVLRFHSNGIRCQALDAQGREVFERTYYSLGGGFVLSEEEAQAGRVKPANDTRPYPYRCGDDLLRLARDAGLSVSEMTLQNEKSWRPEAETRARLLAVWAAMRDCVERGCHGQGALPGALQVRRRAPRLHRELTARPEAGLHDPLTVMDWVSLYAMAVNEENAAGGRVVTAPTNGAAGIIPAVLHYYVRIHGGATDDHIVRFLLTAGAVGLLYKLNASISGAEVGCQGEVGVACSMAAAALAEVLGGTVPQVEEAAEIGMEHNLGLTCDPVGGLVQVPCIERNAMGAVKAINAARLALHGDGQHRVSLDKVIATMRQTGADMSTKYKETARGGLALNVPVC